MELQTDRLHLRPLRPADAWPLAELWSHPDVTRFMGGPRNYDFLVQDFKADALRPEQDAFDLWPVLEIATAKVVGHCGLLEKEVDGEPEIELVYVFRRSAWGRGYATEIAMALRDYARDEMALKRLVSLIDPENEASARVARNVGMTLEKETRRGNNKLMHVYATSL